MNYRVRFFRCFHSTKEVSKGIFCSCSACSAISVSIPLRKFPRAIGGVFAWPECEGFHSTKEVSKVVRVNYQVTDEKSFHSTKEVSKAGILRGSNSILGLFPFH